MSAAIPHPQEVLALEGYNPDEHLLASANHNNIATIPGHPTTLLRWFPYDYWSSVGTASVFEPMRFGEPRPILTAMMADTLEQWHSESMHALIEHGLPVAEHVTHVGLKERGKHQVPTLYTTVRKLDGEAMDSTDEKGKDVISRLAKYVMATVAGRKPLLNDIYRPEQYTIPHQGNKPVLHDIEPRFRTDYPSGNYMGIDYLEHWLYNLGLPKSYINT